jgi:hypothetical protein
VLWLVVTLGHKLVRGPHRDPPFPSVHSLLSLTPRIRLTVFSKTYALFRFPYHTYPASFLQFAHSCTKNRGYTPTRFTLSKKRRANPPKLQRRRNSFVSPAYGYQPRMSFVSPTYAKQGGVYPLENVGAPTFLIFALIFRTFLALGAVRRVARQMPAADGGRYQIEEGGLKPPLQRQWDTDHGTRATCFLSTSHPLALSNAEGSQSTSHSLLATRHFCAGRWAPATGHLLCYPIHRRLFLP